MEDKYTHTRNAIVSKSNCNYENHSNIFRGIAIAILIFGFIGSIILGDTFKIPSKSVYSDDTFNTALMIYSMIGTVVISVLMYAIHLHLVNQETLVQMQSINNVFMAELTEKEQTETSTNA